MHFDEARSEEALGEAGVGRKPALFDDCGRLLPGNVRLRTDLT